MSRWFYDPKSVSWPHINRANRCNYGRMGTNRRMIRSLPMGDQPVVELALAGPVVADTFGGRIHVEWDDSAPVTPLGQMPFFIEFIKQGGLFGGLVADCPLHYASPNAPRKRDVLGTTFLSVLAGHWRYAHMTTVRCDSVNPPPLGMMQVVSEDAVRRGLDKIDERGRRELAAGTSRLHDATAFERAVGSRRRYHGEAALRTSGRRRGELQSSQAGTTVAQLSLLHDGQPAAGAGGGGGARQRAHLQALLAAPVEVLGWFGTGTAAMVDPRRCRFRQRAGDAGSRTARPELPFQAASDEEREARDRTGDEGAGLAGCRPRMARQGRPVAPYGMEPAPSHRDPAAAR